MYCPICREEFREGFSWCPECHASLINVLSEEQVPEHLNLVSVFEGDSSSAAVVRSMIEGIGIEAWIKNEEEHGVFPNLEPTVVLVCKANEKKALEAIESPGLVTATNYDDNHATSGNCQNEVLGHKRLAANNDRKESNISKKQNEKHGKGHQGNNKRRQPRI
jgi:hypothetical protein